MSAAEAGRAPERPSPAGDEAERGATLVGTRTTTRPVTAVVLGSGLGGALTADIEADAELAFGELPGFPPSSIPGHDRKLEMGTLFGRASAVFHGRVHFYEGHGMAAATLIPRLAASLGARTLILTNAAGGLEPTMSPGDLMLVTDHVNWMGADPLFGWHMSDGSPAFVDTSHAYDMGLADLARIAARDAGVVLLEGVYAAASGPSYETPAERAALRALGADAVGMSTVPEAVAAAALGMRTLAISCITNVVGQEADHGEVLAAAGGASPALRAILAGVFDRLEE